MQMINPGMFPDFVVEVASWFTWHAPIALIGAVLVVVFAGLMARRSRRDH